jgi:ABC-2 type transport system ATP-binding protein
MTDAAAPAILIEGLVKQYGGASGVRAVDGIDLEVRRGEIFGFLGPNGAGKTTTIAVCTTRARATAGTVHVVGVNVATDPARLKRHIGVVTQYSTLDRSLTALENLAYHARYFGAGAKEARRRAEELLERFTLSDAANRMPDQLSGGMAQRLQIARAIGHGPQVLFLDEPTAGLDPQSRLVLWDLVRDLRRDGVTILLTTHDMAEADTLCDRVAIIDHGRILVCDRPDHLRAQTSAPIEVHLTFGKPADDLIAPLSAVAGVQSVQGVPDGLRLIAASRDGLVQRVVEASRGHALQNLSVKEPTLETIFIQLTGRDLRD